MLSFKISTLACDRLLIDRLSIMTFSSPWFYVNIQMELVSDGNGVRERSQVSPLVDTPMQYPA